MTQEYKPYSAVLSPAQVGGSDCHVCPIAPGVFSSPHALVPTAAWRDLKSNIFHYMLLANMGMALKMH